MVLQSLDPNAVSRCAHHLVGLITRDLREAIAKRPARHLDKCKPSSLLMVKDLWKRWDRSRHKALAEPSVFEFAFQSWLQA